MPELIAMWAHLQHRCVVTVYVQKESDFSVSVSNIFFYDTSSPLSAAHHLTVCCYWQCLWSHATIAWHLPESDVVNMHIYLLL